MYIYIYKRRIHIYIQKNIQKTNIHKKVYLQGDIYEKKILIKRYIYKEIYQ